MEYSSLTLSFKKSQEKEQMPFPCALTSRAGEAQKKVQASFWKEVLLSVDWGSVWIYLLCDDNRCGNTRKAPVYLLLHPKLYPVIQAHPTERSWRASLTLPALWRANLSVIGIEV